MKLANSFDSPEEALCGLTSVCENVPPCVSEPVSLQNFLHLSNFFN